MTGKNIKMQVEMAMEYGRAYRDLCEGALSNKPSLGKSVKFGCSSDYDAKYYFKDEKLIRRRGE